MTKVVEYIDYSPWVPTVIVAEKWNVCPKCGDSSIHAVELERSEKLAALVHLHNQLEHIGEKPFTLIRKMLCISLNEFEKALRLQKRNRLRKKKPHGPENCSLCRDDRDET